MSTSTATRCRCGQPTRPSKRRPDVTVCDHCDQPCARNANTCTNCRAQHTRP